MAELRSYRIYMVGADGHLDGAPRIVECDDDAQAIAQAEQMQDGLALEVWDGARFVTSIAAPAVGVHWTRRPPTRA